MSKLRHKESWYSRTKKELEEMDYKEKYEKALEWMKSIYPTMQGSDKEDAEHYFPELAESEDERIMKFLVDYFASYKIGNVTTKLNGVRIDDILNYLEKQKERRAYWELYKGVSESEWFKENYAGKSLGEEEKQKEPHYTKRNALFDKCVKNCDPDIMKKVSDEVDEMLQQEQKPIDPCDASWDAYYQRGYQRGLEVGRKEQKPAEWSEDYRDEDLRTRFAFYTYKDEDDVLYLSNVFVEETSRNKGFGTKILAAAEKVAETIGAINIRLKVKQNSPANAWYRKHGYGYMAFEGDYDWLEKTLEYLKPIKPEWSEEDERRRDGIIQWLREYQERFNPKYDSLSIESIESLIDWLKSLRPSWKPSEAHLSALLAIFNDPNNIGSQTCQLALTDLYEQLKAIKKDKK